MIYLSGAPSHQDMYDLKMEAPIEIRGSFRPIATKVTGIQILRAHAASRANDGQIHHHPLALRRRGPARVRHAQIKTTAAGYDKSGRETRLKVQVTPRLRLARPASVFEPISYGFYGKNSRFLR
jgi:hypothetical protein